VSAKKPKADPETKRRAAIIQDMKMLASATYNMFFKENMAGKCHAFMEFNGLLSKYIELCQAANEAGIDFTTANKHHAQALPVAEHDMEYLAEKIECMFGPTLRANPKARAAFLRVLLGEEHDEASSA
jgi:hypothetical protein